MIRLSLKRPITILVVFMGLLIFSIVALKTIPIDIFPKLNAPTIYVIEQYGGMSANQMEGFFSTRMQDQFLYVNGIKNIESKNIQGLSLLKLNFYEGTDMGEASAQVALQVNRTMAFFPPGALPPQVVRFDASSLPVGELVFSSKDRPLKDIFDLALTKVRPLFATVPGLSASLPFGSNARTVLINVDPDKLKMYNLSADQVVESIARNNSISPSGNLRMGNTMYITSTNTLETKVQKFEDIPLVSNGTTAIYLKDVASVLDGADITMNYALVNGKRSVYLPVVKTADASTWDVVQALRKKIPEMNSLLPQDVRLSYEFDQSVFVIDSAMSLLSEGIIGAVLTGLMVLLFLRDWRSSLVVIITIPVAVMIAVLLLKLSGQTINIMTLSGLALAIGILVDESTVTIENIHQHFEMGKNKKQAILDACQEISFPKLLILLCILAVFAPSFFMTGVPRAMFLPLSLSIGFAMIVSFLASQSLVPVLSVWILKAEKFQKGHYSHKALPESIVSSLHPDQINEHNNEEEVHLAKPPIFQRLKSGLVFGLKNGMPTRKLRVIIYLILSLVAAALAYLYIGKDLLPKTNNGQIQLRIQEPEGTRLEVTEKVTKMVLEILDSSVHHHIAISSAFVGVVPANFGSSNLYIFNSGTHEAVIQMDLAKSYKPILEELKEEIRKNILSKFPELKISFEPIELTEKIMAQGASTPIEIQIAGKNMKEIEDYTSLIREKLLKVNFLRDILIRQPLKYPTISIHVDRNKLALMGLTIDQVSKSITDATSSSRYTDKNLWLDQGNSYTYQSQVQVPEYIMNSTNQLLSISLVKNQMRPVLGDVASLEVDSLPAEYDRIGPRRYISLSANLYHKDLGGATETIYSILKSLKPPPPGLLVEVKGMSALLTQTLDSLQVGLIAAILVIFLLLAANFQSFGLSLAVLSSIPAVLIGSIVLLLLTGSTVNLQSYMGIIMSTGVSVSNAVLIVSSAERLRIDYRNPFKAAYIAAGMRLRPIMMTSLAMIVGMIPMASGLGEAGDQSAPLGRAVIGGLAASTLATLFVVPLVYAWICQNTGFRSASLLPEDSNQ